MKKLGLLPRLILAIIIGVLLGKTGFLPIARLMNTFNVIFGNFLSFLIPLIILSLVATGIADLGKKANGLLVKTVLFAYISSISAGLLAYFVGIKVLPNMVSEFGGLADVKVEVLPYFTLNMPPVMGIMSALVLAFVLGLGMANLKSKVLVEGFREFQKIISSVIAKVLIPLIPIHIAGIFSRITIEGKLLGTAKAFSSLLLVIILLQLFYVLVQYTIASFYGKKSFVKSIKNVLPAYFTAFGTQSSAATIPVSRNCGLENDVEEDIADFVLPLCATIHLAGDTIALVIGGMGFLIGMGIVPTLSMILPFIFMLGITMIAAPGIPGGGVMAALGLLESMLSFGASQQALMIALHFSQDSFGTATNVAGDGAMAIVINKSSQKVKKAVAA